MERASSTTNTPARATLERWHTQCRASAKAENLIRVDGTLYCIAPDGRQLQNGAITGRIHRFDVGYGFRDIGAFRIAPDGALAACPDALRAALSAPLEQPAARCVHCSNAHASEQCPFVELEEVLS